MAAKRRVLTASLTFLSLVPLLASFQCYGLMLCQMLLQFRRQQQLCMQAASQFNRALARYKHIRRRVVCRRERIWRHPGRTDQWWKNLYSGVLPVSEWRKNLRMTRESFMTLADELRPFLQPGRSPRGLDVISVENNNFILFS